MKKTSPPRIVKMPAAKQKRMHALLDKNSNGTITPKERALLEQLVAEAERLMVANAERLAGFSKAQGGPRRRGAVPVTVWVQPSSARR